MTKKELKKYRARAKRIMLLRDVNKLSFQAIGSRFGITKQRAYQIYLNAKKRAENG